MQHNRQTSRVNINKNNNNNNTRRTPKTRPHTVPDSLVFTVIIIDTN